MAPYMLQCEIQAYGLRTLKSMLQCLQRFGSDLFLEANSSEVTLRTLNTAQSAFIVFTLGREFFSTYQIQPGKSASVKLFLKNFQNIFRTTAGVNSVWLQIATGTSEGNCGDEEDDEAHMRIQLLCASGLRKKFDLSFQEVTSMNAVYDRTVCPHTICADPSVILECLKNFPPTLAEVCLVAAADALTLKNEVEGSDETDSDSRLVRTEMRLKPTDLRQYDLGPLPPGGSVAVSFSQREFKAILTLVKELEHLLQAHIEAPGCPIIFVARPHSDVPYRMECVLATVVETTSLGDDGDFGDMFGNGQASPTGAGGASLQGAPAQYHGSFAHSMYGTHPPPHQGMLNQPSYLHPSQSHPPQPPVYPSQPSFQQHWPSQGHYSQQAPPAHPQNSQHQHQHLTHQQGMLHQQAYQLPNHGSYPYQAGREPPHPGASICDPPTAPGTSAGGSYGAASWPQAASQQPSNATCSCYAQGSATAQSQWLQPASAEPWSGTGYPSQPPACSISDRPWLVQPASHPVTAAGDGLIAASPAAASQKMSSNGHQVNADQVSAPGHEDSDTEEEDGEGVPGTPPDPEYPENDTVDEGGWPNKRFCQE